MQGMQKITEKRKEKKSRWSFFWKGKQICMRQMQDQKKNTRKLHLEMFGDKVTYVRVYWLRSQVRSLDHRSYSLFKLKMGLPFFCLSIFMYSHLEQISTSPSLYTMCLKTRKHETLQTYPLTNSMLSFMIVILYTQVLFLAKLTHLGRWTQIPSGAPNSW